MAVGFPAGIFLAALFLLAVVVLGGITMRLELERAIPAGGVGMSQLRARDRVRHGRLLQSLDGVVDFPVAGTYDPMLVGLYYTKLQLGTPPREFYVQIDTGSDVLWIGCANCNGCPETSGLPIQLNLYDPRSSSTASLISCSDQRCSLGAQSSDSGCSLRGNECSYTFQYGDGSGTAGYYVSDLLQLDMIVGYSLPANSSASIVLGCSTTQTGGLMKSDRAVDGIFGFGQQALSVISQLSSQGITPRVFSHCLRGGNAGGGILVLGEIVEPGIVYTPLVPLQILMTNLFNLQAPLQPLSASISVNGQILAIDSSVFSTSDNQGTIVDSGTTLAYLAEAAYDLFTNAITKTVTQSVRPILSNGNQCYLITSSVNDIFPQVSLNFAGGASIVLNPQDYLIPGNSVGDASLMCLGFGKSPGQGITILGDIVLKDKIVVYDLANQRMGWANYDCSMSVNVSTTNNTGKREFVNAGQMSNDGLSVNGRGNVIAFALSVIIFMILGLLLR